MKTLQTKILTIISVVLLSMQFALQSVFAAPLQAQFFTSSFDANVGDTIVMELKVVPTTDKPAYTVGATLKYDPSLVSFVNTTFDKNWLGLSRSPYELTDTSSGIITRTAGYPEGLKSTGSFVKYTFTAKAPGKAVMNISSGMSLDAENNDAGLQNKTITINIKGKEAPAPTAPAEVAASKAKPQTITIDIVGDTAFYSSKDYSFQIPLKLKEAQSTTGTTSVSIYNQDGAEVYKDEKGFTGSTDTSLAFTIPANSLPQGNYSIMAESKYDNQKSPTSATKNIGSLDQNDKIVNNNVEVPFIPLYMYIIIAILLLILFFVLVYSKSKKFRKFLKNF